MEKSNYETLTASIANQSDSGLTYNVGSQTLEIKVFSMETLNILKEIFEGEGLMVIRNYVQLKDLLNRDLSSFAATERRLIENGDTTSRIARYLKVLRWCISRIEMHEEEVKKPQPPSQKKKERPPKQETSLLRVETNDSRSAVTLSWKRETELGFRVIFRLASAKEVKKAITSASLSNNEFEFALAGSKTFYLLELFFKVIEQNREIDSLDRLLLILNEELSHITMMQDSGCPYENYPKVLQMVIKIFGKDISMLDIEEMKTSRQLIFICRCNRDLSQEPSYWRTDLWSVSFGTLRNSKKPKDVKKNPENEGSSSPGGTLGRKSSSFFGSGSMYSYG